jgi:hypothetical protein
VDFDENKNQSHAENISKNRKTLFLLFMMFITPVLLAYAAYFGSWFSGPGAAQGELIESAQVTDIEDYAIFKTNGEKYTGKEFETLYWWILPIQVEQCNQTCVNLNIFTINQTYLGLGKQASKIKKLVIFEKGNELDAGSFPHSNSDFTSVGMKAIDKTHSGKGIDLPANYIYLVDPLGNIFMKYPLLKDKEEAPIMSGKLRKDILHLFKYSRLG